MQLKMADNIRTFRKKRRLTQEQLAEALGVTVGAVSKWESGSSVPDINLIIAMAGFFETSVDVLLGYEWQSGAVSQIVEKIRTLRNEKKFDEATGEAERAMQRYPNSFEIIYSSAQLYYMMGIEKFNKKTLRRSLSLMERSLELIEQNTDENISEWGIWNEIASLYLNLEETEKALEIVKKYNYNGINDGTIGVIHSNNQNPDEALPYLSDALVNHITELIWVIGAYTNCYTQKNDLDSAVEAQEWLCSVFAGLKTPGKVSYVDRLEAMLLCHCALLKEKKEDLPAIHILLSKAILLARNYEKAPSYTFTNMKFYHSKKAKTAFDDMGLSMTEGLRGYLEQDEETTETTLPIWDKLISKTDDELKAIINGGAI